MRPVHLRVMELERNGERRFQKSAVISAPDDERVAEYSAVHGGSDRSVDWIGIGAEEIVKNFLYIQSEKSICLLESDSERH